MSNIKLVNGYFDWLSPEIEAMIFDILPLPDLASFSKTRLQNQLGITDYVTNRRNNLFKKYIADIPIFIQLLEFTGSVVSGSTALNLFMPKSQEFATHDIDLYATEKYEHVVVEYLKREEGYTVAHKISSKTGYDSSAIAKIYKLENGQKHMDIIITHWTCAVAPILQFHSTVVMNYITANSIVSMYSKWTCQRKGFIHPRLYMEGKTNPRTVDALMKYTERGFKLYAEPLQLGQHDCQNSTDCPHATRTTLDNRMFHWNIDTGVTMETTTIACADMPVMVWSLGGYGCVEENEKETMNYILVAA